MTTKLPHMFLVEWGRLKIAFINARYVAMPKTIGFVFHDRAFCRFCFWWFHITILWSDIAGKLFDQEFLEDIKEEAENGRQN